MEYDACKRMVHLLEGHSNRTDRALEGFAITNPLSGIVEFTAYNSDIDLLFKGHYTLLSQDTLCRIYDVYYPHTHQYYKMGHAILTFRETMTLSADDHLLYNRVEYFGKKVGGWLPWSMSVLVREEEAKRKE